MRAMVLDTPAPAESSPLEPRELPDPVPGDHQVRIRVQACGVCRTDLHEIEGELPQKKQPLVPGHQVVGTIDALGPGAGDRFQTGERAGLPWLHETCGECPQCLAGQENLCSRARFTGYDVDGGFAEYVIAPETFTVRVPPELSPRAAAPLLCGGIIGYRALRVCGLHAGETLALYGFGASAHICIQVARYWRCPVQVFSRTPEHRALAGRLGAAWTGEAGETPPTRPDRAIIFAPAGWLIPVALENLEKGGTVALAGIYVDQIPPLDYERHLYMEKVLRSVTAATRRDGDELMALAAQIPIQTETESFPLEEANQALLRLKRSELNGAAVLEIA